MKKIYKISRWVHKYIGLLILLFLIYMSISGIIMNHPEIISKIDVSMLFLPNNYEPTNWNRSSIINLNYSKKEPNLIYASGLQGIWHSKNGGKSFESLMENPFPKGAYNRKTKTSLLIEKEDQRYLLAGTYDGLFKYDLIKKTWEKISIPGHFKFISKIILVEIKVFVFSDSELFIAQNFKNLTFKKQNIRREGWIPQKTYLSFFFDLHSGELWGLPGQLIYDLVGIVIIFLSISAMYIWFFPSKSKLFGKIKFLREKKYKNYFQWNYKYHLKLGIWCSLIIFFIAFTGLFLRPPFMAFILNGSFAERLSPGIRISNVWHHKIRNAMYDSLNHRLIIDAKDGLWASKNGTIDNFEEVISPVPIFAMGATVFEQDENYNLLIGSFSGLFRVDLINKIVTDEMTGMQPMMDNSLRPSGNLITGYFKGPSGKSYVTTHFTGLVPIRSNYSEISSKMPIEASTKYKMSLWNWMFELHNGRIFEAWIGDWYLLIIPLGSLLFLLIIFTGIFDWLYKYFKKKKKNLKINEYHEEELIENL